jgi:peptide/nickel transport system permease protein
VHVLRNSLVPIVTLTGIQFGYLLGGTVIVEQIFAMPGLGRLLFTAISDRDYPRIRRAWTSARSVATRRRTRADCAV